jgi:SAM-dependent methyltransferase
MRPNDPATRPSDPYSSLGNGTRTLELLESAARYNGWLFSWLEPYLGARCVELGAGSGTLTRFALERHSVLACEPSDVCREALEQRFRGHAGLLGVTGDFTDVPGENAFDAVYSANVLEHIADDAAVLRHAARVLRPGGCFVAVVPAGAWLYSAFDASIGHHRRYTRADRTRLTGELQGSAVPLRLKTFEHRNPVGALGWAVKMRWGGRRQIDPDDVQRVERLVPLLRHIDRVPIPFGQSLLMVWERT